WNASHTVLALWAGASRVARLVVATFRCSPPRCQKPTASTRARGRASRGVLALERRCAEVAERLVALANRLLEAGLRGTLLKRVPLVGVTGYPVENGAEDLGLVQALGVEGLVELKLDQLQLVERITRDAAHEDLGALVEVSTGRRLDCQAPLERLCTRQRVACEKQALGALRAQSVGPHRRRRRAPDPGRRIADLGIGGDDQQVAAQRHVRPPADAEAVHLADHRLGAVKKGHESADMSAHHPAAGQ